MPKEEEMENSTNTILKHRRMWMRKKMELQKGQKNMRDLPDLMPGTTERHSRFCNPGLFLYVVGDYS